MLDQFVVRQRLEKLAERDTGFTIFGSRSHQYRLGPPLAEGQVAELEHEMGIELPADYRSFVSTIGNGGAGPGYGLTPLKKTADYVRSDGASSQEGQRWGSSPAQPFPLVTPLLGSEDLESYTVPPCTGMINLGGYGCGHDPYLVVAGAERGHVWFLDLASDGGVYPFTISDTGYLHDESRGYPATFEEMAFASRFSFSEWYDDWLESTERLLARALVLPGREDPPLTRT